MHNNSSQPIRKFLHSSERRSKMSSFCSLFYLPPPLPIFSSNEDFQMFQSTANPDHRDLLFQDSTVRLVPVPADQQNHKDYLGESFTRAMERMEGIDCVTDNSGHMIISGITMYLSIFTCVLSVFFACV